MVSIIWEGDALETGLLLSTATLEQESFHIHLASEALCFGKRLVTGSPAIFFISRECTLATLHFYCEAIHCSAMFFHCPAILRFLSFLYS